jgi:hypothetical protein
MIFLYLRRAFFGKLRFHEFTSVGASGRKSHRDRVRGVSRIVRKCSWELWIAKALTITPSDGLGGGSGAHRALTICCDRSNAGRRGGSLQRTG